MGRRSSTTSPVTGVVWPTSNASVSDAPPPAFFVRHPDEAAAPLTRRAARASVRETRLAQSSGPAAEFGAGSAPVQPKLATRRSARAAERATEEAPTPSEIAEAAPTPVAAAPTHPTVVPAPARDETPLARRSAVRLAPRAHSHAARHIDVVAARRSRRRVAATASAASIGLVSSLIFALPANATTAERGFVTVDAHGHTAAQILAVSPQVSTREVQHESSVAAALAGIVASQDGVQSASAATVIAAALQAGGPRQSIVETALSYLGDPYVLGGSDHTGIDCSGLTMQAYASIGIRLVHLVSAQDAVGVVIQQAAAKPGDLVVFDDNEHIGIYLGANLLIAAPEAGRPVTVEQVWSGIPHHFTRILPAGQ